MEERKAILKKQGRCFICLRSASHLARNCDSKNRCTGCGRRHHLADCEVGRAQHSESFVVEGTACNGLSEVATSAMHVGSSMHVFLQTAQAMVSRPGAEGTQSWKGLAIFDTGAQRSYVSQRVVNALNLETISTEKLMITTFGNQKQELQTINLVELGLRKPGIGFNLTLNAFSVPHHICSDLQGEDLNWIKENYARLRDIEFDNTTLGV